MARSVLEEVLNTTGHSGYKGHVYKGQPLTRDILAGTESFPFILV